MRNRHLYPDNWEDISLRIRKERANDKCEWCGAVNAEPHPVTGSRVILTVAHLDQNRSNNDDSNLAALCQKCHLGHDRIARKMGFDHHKRPTLFSHADGH